MTCLGFRVDGRNRRWGGERGDGHGSSVLCNTRGVRKVEKGKICSGQWESMEMSLPNRLGPLNQVISTLTRREKIRGDIRNSGAVYWVRVGEEAMLEK